MTYHIYHIPGKKIGVTENLEARVHTQQGYGPGEYELLESSDDIDFISELELVLQKEYGYKVDRELYLFPKFAIIKGIAGNKIAGNNIKLSIF